MRKNTEKFVNLAVVLACAFFVTSFGGCVLVPMFVDEKRDDFEKKAHEADRTREDNMNLSPAEREALRGLHGGRQNSGLPPPPSRGMER